MASASSSSTLDGDARAQGDEDEGHDGGHRRAPPGRGGRAVALASQAMQPLRILVVEDDDAIAAGLVRVLDSQGYAVRRLARGGARARRGRRPTSGSSSSTSGCPTSTASTSAAGCARARPDLAILILTARDQELDVVAGLDAGRRRLPGQAVPAVRAARPRPRAPAARRRSRPGDRRRAAARPAACASTARARRAWRDGAELELRPKEFDLLALLVAEAGRAVTRERIMREVWDTDWLGSTKTLDTHVLALRSKLGRRGDHHAARRRLPLRGDVRRRLVLAIAGVAAARRVALRRAARRSSLARSYRDEELLRLQRDTIAATRADRRSARAAAIPSSCRARATRSPSTTAPGGRVAGRGPGRAPTRSCAAALRTGRPRRTRTGGGRLVVAVPLLERRARQPAPCARERGDAAVARDTRRAWLALAGARRRARRGRGARRRWCSARRLAAAARAARRRRAPARRRRLRVRAPRAGIAGGRRGRRGARRHRARGSTTWSPASARSAPTPRTSCARRWRRCASSSRRWSCAATTAAELAAALGQVDRLQATIDTLLAVARDAPRRDARADLGALLDDVGGALARRARRRRRGRCASAPRGRRRRAARVAGASSARSSTCCVANAARHGAGRGHA